MPIIDIKPGPELDLAVAKACGLEARICDFVFGGKICVYKSDGGRELNFQPSTNANNALFTVEKLEFFGNEWFDLSHNRNQGWMVVGFYECTVGRRGQPTAALAICEAILKFVEEHSPKVPDGN